MARVLVTGSTDGLGRATADALLDGGHEVVVHARTAARSSAVQDLVRRGARAVVGDLFDPDETRGVADQVNRLGPMDAVIHNAGTMTGALVLPVNVVAPYLLTALVDGPARLVYLSSSMHFEGRKDLDDLDWTGRRHTASYSDSKLLVTVLAAAVARIRPTVASNAVDPGWVPTRMGGPGAPDDLVLGHRTQVWLAVGDEPEAVTTGGYWHHRQRSEPHAAVHDPVLQEELVGELARHTGVELV